MKSHAVVFMVVMSAMLLVDFPAKASSDLGVSCDEITRIAQGYADGSITEPGNLMGVSTTCAATAGLVKLEACRSRIIAEGVTPREIDHYHKEFFNVIASFSGDASDIRCPGLPPLRAEMLKQ